MNTQNRDFARTLRIVSHELKLLSHALNYGASLDDAVSVLGLSTYALAAQGAVSDMVKADGPAPKIDRSRSLMSVVEAAFRAGYIEGDEWSRDVDRAWVAYRETLPILSLCPAESV